jgi:hypothetical protein
MIFNRDFFIKKRKARFERAFFIDLITLLKW